MPFSPEDEFIAEPIGRLPPEPETQDHPFTERFAAFFQQANSIGSLWSHQLGLSDNPDPSFDPFKEIEGTPYADYSEAFIYANTPEDVVKVKAQVDQEHQADQIRSEGGPLGVIAALSAGLLDPILLVPIGGAAFTAGKTVLEAGARTALAGALAISADEAVLHATQITRTYGESAMNISTGALLSGVLGGALSKLSVARRARFERIIREDMDLGAMKGASKLDPDKVGITPEDLGFEDIGATIRGLGGEEKFRGVNAKQTGETDLAYRTRMEQKLESLRRVYEHPNTNPNEADVARRMAQGIEEKLKAMGAESPSPPSPPSPPPPPAGGAQAAGPPPPPPPPPSPPPAGASAAPPSGGGMPPPPPPQPGFSNAPQPPTPPSPPTTPSGPIFEKLSGALGVEKASALVQMTPALDVMVNSQSPVTRGTMLRLAEMPMELEKNATGLPTEPTVESRVLYKTHSRQAVLAREGNRLYDAYRRRIAGKAIPPPNAVRDYRNRIANAGRGAVDIASAGRRTWLSRSEFEEKAGLAATQGDVRFVGEAAAEITEYAKIVRREIVDPIKDEAIALGLLPPGIRPETAVSYLMRVYKNEKIRQDPGDAFRHFAARWFMAAHPGNTSADAWRVAGEIRQHILGTPGGRLPYEAMEIGGASPLKGRVFTADDSELHQLGVLDTNLARVTNMYIHTMTADIEMMREFGTVRFGDSDARQAIIDDYDRLDAAASAPAQTTGAAQVSKTGEMRTQLHRERDRMLWKLGAIWDRIRGTPVYSASTPPDALAKRWGLGIRQFTALGMAGRFAINSFSDFGGIITEHGMMRTMGDSVKILMSGLERIRLTAGELHQAAATVDTLIDSKGGAMADLTDQYRGTTRLERGLRTLVDNYYLINGLSPLTTAQKQFGGMLTHQRILEVVEEIANGRGKQRDIRALATWGIGPVEARRIASMSVHWDQARPLWLSNSEQWTDDLAVDAYRLALRRAVDSMVMTPHAADVPIILSTETGKLVGQFRIFNLAGTNRILIPLLQKVRHGDAIPSAMAGLVSRVGLGMVVYWLISRLSDKPVSDRPETWIAEGIDRGGALGFYADINNLLEVASRGEYGVNAMLGGPILSRYAGRNYLGALLGPQVSRMEDIAKLTGALSTGEVSQADTRAMRRMWPYQNYWAVDKMFDLAESAVNESLGIPERAPRR